MRGMILPRPKEYLNDDYRVHLVIKAKAYETLKQQGFPYRSLVRKLESWDMTFDEFMKLMKRINKLNDNHGKAS